VLRSRWGQDSFHATPCMSLPGMPGTLQSERVVAGRSGTTWSCKPLGIKGNKKTEKAATFGSTKLAFNSCFQIMSSACVRVAVVDHHW
jgi:hypothetical protein